MIVKIFTGPLNYDVSSLYIKEENEYIIGVDQACELLIQENIQMDLALGDFDSLKIPIDVIETNAKAIIKFDSIKDHTDTTLAIYEALKISKDIIIYGGIGERLDHTFSNILVLHLGNIVVKNNSTEMYVLKPGSHTIMNQYKYVSFFALDTVKNLSLKGFQYEIESFDLDTLNPIGTSNSGEGTVSFDEGYLLVIKSNE